MSEDYGIAPRLLKKIRGKYKKCVYCHKQFRKGPDRRLAWASIEHINNDGPMTREWNLAMCCFPCNSSKGQKSLKTWLRSSYCTDRKKPITPATVASVIKRYLKRTAGF